MTLVPMVQERREIVIELTLREGVLQATLRHHGEDKVVEVHSISMDRLGAENPLVLRYSAPPLGKCELCGA